MVCEVSVVIPVYNEVESLHSFFESLIPPLENIQYELIFINDGSIDTSLSFLKDKSHADHRVKIIDFTKNFGQTAALAAGIEVAQGDIIICMDADGQNDPADIPHLISEMKRGADVVSGWRYHRKDSFFTRRLPSMAANAIISWVTGVSLHDYGCTLKAYRRSVLQDIRLYGEMHRFIPAWCAWKGAKIVEVKVNHHARQQGKSKYGIGRTFKVLLDLITAKFFSAYLNKPSYFFGGTGLLFMFFGFLAGLFPILDKFIFFQWGHLRIPFLIFSIFLGLLGVQFIVLGLLAEILIRIYYETKDERPYRIKEIIQSNKAEGRCAK